MLRLKNLANKYQKRTCRPLYANTQATPYAASLATTFRATDGSLQLPASGDTTPLGTRTAAAYTSKGSLLPGMVAVRVTGTETVGIATGIDVAERPLVFLRTSLVETLMKVSLAIHYRTRLAFGAVLTLYLRSSLLRLMTLDLHPPLMAQLLVLMFFFTLVLMAVLSTLLLQAAVSQLLVLSSVLTQVVLSWTSSHRKEYE